MADIHSQATGFGMPFLKAGNGCSHASMATMNLPKLFMLLSWGLAFVFANDMDTWEPIMANDEKYKNEVVALFVLTFPIVLSCHSSDLLESSTV
jgi:hypothetical protein